MKLSLENEIRLKHILRSDNKTKECDTIADEIQSKEKALTSHITREYLSIIKKCDSLKMIKKKIPLLLEKNESLVCNLKEIHLEISNIENEMNEYKHIDRKIDEIIKELQQIEVFFSIITTNISTENSCYWYKSATNMKRIVNIVSSFVHYRFYDTLYELYINYKDGIDTYIKKITTSYLVKQEQESVAIGQNIVEMLSENTKDIIFSNIESLRSTLVSTEFLDVLYYKTETKEIDCFLDFFNTERKKTISRRTNNMLYTYCTYILCSYYLRDMNKNILDYYDFMLDSVNDHIVQFDKEQTFEIKDTLLSINMLLRRLNINNNNINEVIGRVCIDYFTSNNLIIENYTREEYKQELFRYIYSGYQLLDRIHNNEINEIFVNKIDMYIKEYAETTKEETVINDLEYILRVYKEVKMKCDVPFRSKDWVIQRIDSVKKKVVDQKLPDILHIFADTNNNFSINLQKYIIDNTDYKNEICVIVKQKFVELLDRKSQASLHDRRNFNCIVSCYYRFLQGFDEYLCNDFSIIYDQSKKLIEK